MKKAPGPGAGNERSLPHALEAERSILGVVLVHNDAFARIASTLTAADFYREPHRLIWAAMASLIDEQHSAVDLVTLKEALATRGVLDEVGGPAYIASLADGVPRSTNIAYYARVVKEKALLRGLIFAANTMLQDAYAAEETPAVLLQRADRALMGLQNGHAGRMETLETSTAALYQDVEYSVEHKGELRGVDTGFESLNQETAGWEPGELTVIAARPSIGKSVLVMNMAVAAARSGHRVAVFSIEMRRRQLERRLLSSLSGVPLSRISGGYLGAVDYPKVTDAIQVMQNLPIAIDDRGDLTASDVRQTCRLMRADGGLGLVIVDYVQLMHGTLDRRGANRNEQITDISRRLKQLTDECSVPILLVSQLNRAAASREDKRPQLSDLRESGSLEQDADNVCFLHRKNHKLSGVTTFIIEKQRNGPCGERNLTFDRDISLFTDGGSEPEPTPEEPQPTRASGRKRSFANRYNRGD